MGCIKVIKLADYARAKKFDYSMLASDELAFMENCFRQGLDNLDFCDTMTLLWVFSRIPGVKLPTIKREEGD